MTRRVRDARTRRVCECSVRMRSGIVVGRGNNANRVQRLFLLTQTHYNPIATGTIELRHK